jgi:hypothetical protein
MRSSPVGWVAAAVAALLLSLIPPFVPLARGQPPGPEAALSSPLKPAAASMPVGQRERLVRIGPQALVSIDEHGQPRMVDELEPEQGRAAVLIVVLVAALGGWVAPAGVPRVGGPGLR